jgi:hypothetical protein
VDERAQVVAHDMVLGSVQALFRGEGTSEVVEQALELEQ